MLPLLSSCAILDTSPAHDRLRVLTDEDADGYTLAEGDCNDHDPSVHPDAVDDCDGADTNCDGRIDEVGLLEPLCRDDDGDGHGDPATASYACELAEGRVALCDDCDDHDRDVSPAAAERCDGVDNNCDDETDGDDAVDRSTWYRDEDIDGYGDDASTLRSCAEPDGYVSEPGDCDDREDSVHPGGEEVCGDGEDTNCDGDVSQCGLWGDLALEPDEADPAEGGYIRGSEYLQLLGFEGTLISDTLGDGTGDLVLLTPNNRSTPERLDLWYSAPLGGLTVESAHLTVRSSQVSYMGWCGTLPIADVDGDGRREMLLCAPLDMEGYGAGGRVFAFPVGQTGEYELDASHEVLSGGVELGLFGRHLEQSESISGGPGLVVTSFAGSYSLDDRGMVRVYPTPLGVDTQPASTIEGAREGDQLGIRQTLVKDLDSDGFDDLIVSVEPQEEYLGGSVEVFRGPLGEYATGADADLTVEGPTYQGVGFDVSVSPDLDGDGVAELLVGSSWLEQEGEPHVASWLSGALDGAVNIVTDASMTWTFDPANPTSLETVTGDMNGDGELDVLAGAPLLDDERGAVFGYYGPLRFSGRESFDAQASFVRRGTDPSTALGIELDLGDVDADGVDDLAFYSDYRGVDGYGGAWFLFGEGI